MNVLTTFGLEIYQRFITAIVTIPNLDGWLYATALLLGLAIVSLPIGFLFRFLRLEILPISWQKLVSLLAICFLTPAISEEVFFRVLLLPARFENFSWNTKILLVGLSLTLFIAYHPLNALTFYPSGLKTFFNPIFLFLVGILGIVCSLAYLQTGSLWPPVVIHWLVVVLWLSILGGYRQLNATKITN
jgi:predicted Abi (CAAX) family protease